jgi:N-methylhydantoinase A
VARERAALLRRACEELREAPARIAVRYELRYHGQSFELSVSEDDGGAKNQRGTENNGSAENNEGAGNQAGAPSPQALRESFAQAHEQRYGYRDERSEVELVTIRASAWGAAPAIAPSPNEGALPPQRVPCTLVLDGVEVEAERLDGELPPGTRVSGPALCALPESTLLVPPGWAGEVDAFGTIRLWGTEKGR